MLPVWVLAYAQLLSLWRRAWQPAPVFLPGESHGQRSPVGYSSWGPEELDTTERLTLSSCLSTQSETLEIQWKTGGTIKFLLENTELFKGRWINHEWINCASSCSSISLTVARRQHKENTEKSTPRPATHRTCGVQRRQKGETKLLSLEAGRLI